jgi:hypothetical protein
MECMLCSRPDRSVAMNDSPPVSCAIDWSSAGFTGKCLREYIGWPKRSVPVEDVDVVSVADLYV